MVTLHDSLLSSSARKLPIRKRPDLIAKRQHYLGHSYWVVKDPVGLSYFRFQDEEYAILQMLDGQISLDEIKERFEAEFPPQKITLEELQQFLGTLHRSGLVVASVGGQGHQLRKRRDQRKRQQLIGAVSNVLCIRFKGFDPERLLNRIYPYFRWFFSPWTVAFCLLLALSALTLVVVEFDVFRSKLPDFYQFFSVHNAFLLVLVLGTTKIFHEFGHGLTCKHFGGECHEMGVMILVLTPCLYCNVSDSWLLPNKWQRAAIGAAGIYVEVIMASICTFLWWFSQPGQLFNNLCLNVMFICSVSTILFNANPLLRYDGYYILSDITEIPNLRQKATSILSRKMGQLCLGLEPPDDPFLPQRNQIFFASYSVAAALYRWLVVFSICWFLYKLFQSYELEILGQCMVATALWGLFIMPLYKLAKFFYVPGRIHQVKKPRLYMTLGVLAGALLLFFFLPLPHSVICPLEIQARDAHPVYVDVAGELTTLDVRPDQRVDAEQRLARLENIDLDVEVARIEGTIKGYEAQRRSLLRQSVRDRHAAAQLSQVRESLKTVREQLQRKQADQRRLVLTAPTAGTVLPPTLTPPHDQSEETLPTWSGTPLEPKNIGAFLEQGALFCQVGDPTKLEAVLVVDQADRNLVHPGQQVEIKLEGFPGATIDGTIEEIAESELKVSPKRLSTKSGGELPTKTNPQTGVETPMNTSYQARVPFDDPRGRYPIGLRGQARVYTRWIPMGTRLWRLISHTFNFKL
ncbi:MAG: HlyD family efflux transporter periplasmic adaptor subunit [Pirellulales bacterium]|nr:HlyD family efflux transporter periplasmic adaptor subunit [Pirellulales bacterium]